MEGGIKRGEIWTVVPPRHPKPRPVLVISINALNESAWLEVLIIPLTSVPGPLRVRLPEDPEQTGLRTASYAKCESVGPLYKSRLKKRIGTLPPEAWAPVEAGIRRVLGLRVDPCQAGPVGLEYDDRVPLRQGRAVKQC